MKTQLLVYDLQNVLRFIRDVELQDAEKLLSDIIIDVSFLPDEDEAAQDLARITAERDALNLLLWDVSKCVEPDEDDIFLPVSSEIAKHIFDKVTAALKQSS